jgi:5-methylcytosine-specific restriction endonuclease McrA
MSTQKPTRKELGLCSGCNNPAREGKTQCNKCVERRRKFAKKKREDGYCIQVGCWNIPTNGKVRCAKCTNKRSKYDKKVRKERIANGLCGQCGKPHDESTKLCAPCKKYTLAAVLKKNYGGNRQAVVERDKGTCQCCERPGKAVHHIDNSGIGGRNGDGRKNPNTNNNLENLVLLCSRCHADIHRLGNKKTRHIAARLLIHPGGDLSEKTGKRYLVGWKEVRRRVIARDGSVCLLCKSSKLLVIHHKDDVGLAHAKPNNSLDNLVVLCRGCHGAITHLRNNGDRQLAARYVLAAGPGTQGTRLASELGDQTAVPVVRSHRSGQTVGTKQ